MALKSPLMPSPTFKSAFSPYTDSPSSPAQFNGLPVSNRSSGTSDKSSKSSLYPPPSPYPQHVDPSPVDSQNSASTDATEIEAESPAEDAEHEEQEPEDLEIMSPESQSSSQAELTRLDTLLAGRTRADSDDAPQSVIHAPSGFKQFEAKKSPPARKSTPSPTERTKERTSPKTPEPNVMPEDRRNSQYTAPIDTNIAPAKPGQGETPRAQTRQEAEETELRRRSRASTSNLEDIAEVDDNDREISFADSGIEGETMSQALVSLNQAEQEVQALKAALSECWTLCNTLAGLSSIHRERMFNFSARGGKQEQAWRSCWRLCQNLYESRDEDHASQVRPTLELCREFCQALFEVRQRGDEASDSVLRVSFELNNHLYNTHDRNLPDAFRERTLDFYLTLCHRLMKQRTSLPEETDSLLRACWGLAEMLFSLRQNNRENRPVDEELLGSAVQACWELCDLFREGWTQIRPERGTPRPSQSTFSSSISQSGISNASTSIHTSSERSGQLSSSTYRKARLNPETPTTIFDETEISPDEPPIPNILVLGPETRASNLWSSASSQRSALSDQSSNRTTSSTATIGPAGEDPHLVRLKALILKAALNAGFNRTHPGGLTAYVSALPPAAFGTQPWQMQVLEQYKKLVVADPTLKNAGSSMQGRRVGAAEVARAVQWMGRSEGFGWLRDLFRLVVGFAPDEVGARGNTGFVV